MEKIKKGTKVTVSPEAIAYMRPQLHLVYHNPRTGFNPISFGEILMWAMSDIVLPSGKVIDTEQFDGVEYVRVYLKSKYGECNTWVTKRQVTKKKVSAKKRKAKK